MFTRRKLSPLVTATIITAIAVAAPCASATSAVEVTDEDTHCTEVSVTDHIVSGGCEFSAASEGGAAAPSVDLLSHSGSSEFLFSRCSLIFTIHMDEEGHGYATDQQVGGGGICGLAPCDEAAPSHAQLSWEIQIGEFFADHQAASLRLCLRAASAGEGQAVFINCAMILDVSEPALHEYEFTNTQPCAENASAELIGHWTLDDTSIEIIHL